MHSSGRLKLKATKILLLDLHFMVHHLCHNFAYISMSKAYYFQTKMVLEATRVAMVREKYLENEFFFQVREKSGNLVDGQENKKGLGKSGNLKINVYGRQSSENLFIVAPALAVCDIGIRSVCRSVCPSVGFSLHNLHRPRLLSAIK